MSSSDRWSLKVFGAFFDEAGTNGCDSPCSNWSSVHSPSLGSPSSVTSPTTGACRLKSRIRAVVTLGDITIHLMTEKEFVASGLPDPPERDPSVN
jgi:hypothetical protein